MTADMLCAKVWLNGHLMDADQAFVDPTDRGFTLGDGLFETMLWTGTKVRFFDDHMARLAKSAAMLGIVVPQTIKEIHSGLLALGSAANGERATLRLTLTRGSGPRGLAISGEFQPRLMASVSPFVPRTDPVSLQTVTIARHISAPSARLKTLSYIDTIMALDEARSLGADDALMLGTNGQIACASSANIVVVLKGQSLTPAITDGALPGIIRSRLIDAGLIEEASLSPAQIAACDHAALTNALISVRPVGAIDGRRLEQNPEWIKVLLSALDSDAAI